MSKVIRADVVEIGCIIGVPLDAIATGYNRRMTKLMLADQRRR